MKRVFSKILSLALICALFAGCAAKESPTMPELYIPKPEHELPDIAYDIELKDTDSLPKTAEVYKFISHDADATEEVLKIAELFGLTPDEKCIQYYDKFIIFDDGAYVIDYELPTAMWSVRVSASDIGDADELPSDEKAIELARGFLTEKGLYNERFTVETVTVQYSGSELDSTYAPSLKSVYFYPMLDGCPVLGVSRIIVNIDANGSVVGMMKYYKDFEPVGEIKLAPPENFIDGIQNNRYSSSISPDAVSAKITDVHLGYWEDSGSAEEQPYLQPVWIFKGSSLNADGAESGFDVIVQAAEGVLKNQMQPAPPALSSEGKYGSVPSPDGTRLLYRRSVLETNGGALIFGVSDLSGVTAFELCIDTECSNDILALEWISDSLVGITTHINPSSSEYFVYDIDSQSLLKSFVGSSFAAIPGTDLVMYEQNVPHWGGEPTAHSLMIDDEVVYTSDVIGAKLGVPVFSDDLTNVAFTETVPLPDMTSAKSGEASLVVCDFDLSTRSLKNKVITPIDGDTPETIKFGKDNAVFLP